ncbi:DUF3800 domain-containing protein [Rhizobium leguminosarum]|uniref:DUF3800 domain-containing protein n=1 Tax=Rhizobium leguminosarum TaxID=384 RepID=UPI001C90B457|nr:DUF3800 domain-containing protein [Rhizobium leguminosarum]MBY3026501.1 DUF3800 domain-containing protein [Rhizobium leguminosarum]
MTRPTPKYFRLSSPTDLYLKLLYDIDRLRSASSTKAVQYAAFDAAVTGSRARKSENNHVIIWWLNESLETTTIHLPAPTRAAAEPVEEKKPRKQLLYFCDESSQDGDAYMAVAGIAVARDAIPYILGRMKPICQQFEKTGEVKWKNAKYRGGMVHEGYIRLLFELVDAGRLHFHIRFSRMDEYDHKLSGPRRKIDTVSKAFYQLLLHRPLAYYGRSADLYIYPDDGDCTRQLADQIGALHRETGRACVKEIRPRSSETEPFLQLLDCTLGALAARNGRHEKGDISDTKKRLAKLAFELAGWRDITGSCWTDKKKLNRWNVTPKIKVVGRGRRD